MTSTSCKLEPAIWSHDTGQQIPYFDRCQLIITWMSDIKEVHGKPRLHVLSIYYCSMAAMLRDSTAAVVVVVVRTRPRAIPLAMVHMRKSMGPLHDPVTWYKIIYTGEQVAQWDFQNKGRSR